jgi:hypothetical protein
LLEEYFLVRFSRVVCVVVLLAVAFSVVGLRLRWWAGSEERAMPDARLAEQGRDVRGETQGAPGWGEAPGVYQHVSFLPYSALLLRVLATVLLMTVVIVLLTVADVG